MNTMNLLYLLKAPVKKLNKLFSIQIQIEKFDKKNWFLRTIGREFCRPSHQLRNTKQIYRSPMTAVRVLIIEAGWNVTCEANVNHIIVSNRMSTRTMWANRYISVPMTKRWKKGAIDEIGNGWFNVRCLHDGGSVLWKILRQRAHG